MQSLVLSLAFQINLLSNALCSLGFNQKIIFFLPARTCFSIHIIEIFFEHFKRMSQQLRRNDDCSFLYCKCYSVLSVSKSNLLVSGLREMLIDFWIIVNYKLCFVYFGSISLIVTCKILSYYYSFDLLSHFVKTSLNRYLFLLRM